MTKETYNELKRFIGSTDDFTDDLLNMGYTKGYREGRAKAIDEFMKELQELIDSGYEKLHMYEEDFNAIAERLRENGY